MTGSSGRDHKPAFEPIKWQFLWLLRSVSLSSAAATSLLFGRKARFQSGRFWLRASLRCALHSGILCGWSGRGTDILSFLYTPDAFWACRNGWADTSDTGVSAFVNVELHRITAVLTSKKHGIATDLFKDKEQTMAVNITNVNCNQRKWNDTNRNHYLRWVSTGWMRG